MNNYIELKEYLDNFEIKLYDQQYRIVNYIIKNNYQSGGGIKETIGKNKTEILYKLGKILNY